MYLKPKRRLTIVWAPSPALQSVGVVVCWFARTSRWQLAVQEGREEGGVNDSTESSHVLIPRDASHFSKNF